MDGLMLSRPSSSQRYAFGNLRDSKTFWRGCEALNLDDTSLARIYSLV